MSYVEQPTNGVAPGTETTNNYDNTNNQQVPVAAPYVNNANTFNPGPPNPNFNNNPGNNYNDNGQWSDGLFDCFDVGSICCFSFFLPFYRFALTMERAALGTFNFYFALMLCLYIGLASRNIDVHSVALILFSLCCFIAYVVIGARARQSLRTQYAIPGDTVNDALTWLCCSCCAIAQEARHVDRSIGILSDNQVSHV